MITRSREAIGVALLALLSNSAFGMAAVCSEELSAATGAESHEEQVIWSYYDYWYSGLYVTGDTHTEERLPEDTAYIDTDLTVLAEADGTFMAGYPAPWGVDSFVRIDCVASEDDTESDDDAVQDDSPEERSALTVLLCSSDTSDCAPLPLDDDGRSTADGRASALRSEEGGSLLVIGMIHSVDDGALTIYTDTGRYVTMKLPPSPRLERHTVVNIDALRPGDAVGAVLGGTTRGNHEATLVRVYRDATNAPITASRLASDADAPPGLELRGTLRNVGNSAGGVSLRLAYAAREGSLQLSKDVLITIIEAAAKTDLKPFSVRVRVLAFEQEDGSWLIHSIDIV